MRFNNGDDNVCFFLQRNGFTIFSWFIIFTTFWQITTTLPDHIPFHFMCTIFFVVASNHLKIGMFRVASVGVAFSQNWEIRYQQLWHTKDDRHTFQTNMIGSINSARARKKKSDFGVEMLWMLSQARIIAYQRWSPSLGILFLPHFLLIFMSCYLCYGWMCCTVLRSLIELNHRFAAFKYSFKCVLIEKFAVRIDTSHLKAYRQPYKHTY